MTATRTRADSVEDLVRDTIATVEHNVAEAYNAFTAALGDNELTLDIGPEHFRIARGSVVAAPNTPMHHDAKPAHAASLSTTAHTLHELVAGRIGLTQAVHGRQLTMIGPTRSIAAVDRALRLLLHGVVRSPSAADLMRRLEQLAARPLPATHSPHAPNSPQPEDSP